MRTPAMLAMAVLVGLAITCTAVESEAQRGRGRGCGYGRGGGNPMGCGLNMWLIGDLGLGDQQLVVVEQLRTQWWNDSASVRKQLNVRDAELRALWKTPTISEDAILDTQRDIDLLRQQLRELRAQTMLDFLEILTTDQRAVYTDRSARFSPKWAAGDDSYQDRGGCCRGFGRGRGWRWRNR